MVMTHMCTYGSPGGWQSLTTPLNLVFINPFDAPYIQAKGCHIGWDGYLQGLRDSQRGSLLCQSTSLSRRSRGFGFDFFRLLWGQLGYGASRVLMISFRRGGAEDREECDRASLRSLYKPSASNPATASSTFCNTSASQLLCFLLQKN